MQVIDKTEAIIMFGKTYTATSWHIFEYMKPFLKDYLPGDGAYKNCFHRFEYLWGMACIGMELQGHVTVKPVGCFLPMSEFNLGQGISAVIGEELEKYGYDWPPLKTKFFPGTFAMAEEAKEKYDEYLQSRIHDC
ncbi:MAG: hypothetical protein WC959_01445 [Kiritimatiellales bacterium]